jgi:predicted nucleic acid-binding protein
VSIVIDASVALKWVFDEPGTEAALALRGKQLIAPELWLAEAANALWRHVRLGEITAAEARARMEELANAPVASLAIEPHVARALQFATELLHPVYDCFYLTLADHYDTYVITDDRRFAVAVAARPDLAGRIRLLVN